MKDGLDAVTVKDSISTVHGIDLYQHVVAAFKGNEHLRVRLARKR